MIEEHIIILEEGLLGVRSIPNQLRNDRFFDNKQFVKVIESLKILITLFKDRQSVPKRLSLCFVDISNYFFVDDRYFDSHEINKIEDAGMKLSELANKLFS